MQLSNLWLYRLAQRRVPFRLRANVLPQWGAALVAGAVVWGIAHLFALTTLPRILACGIAGGAVYLALLSVVCPAVFASARSLRRGAAG